MPIFSSSETDALLRSAKYVIRPSVTILPHAILGGGQENVSDRVKAITINASMDNTVMQANVTLNIGEGIDSLSPFYGASAHRAGGIPLCSPGSEILIDFFVGTATSDGEGISTFKGKIDRVGASSRDGTVTLECRDVSAWWLNTMVRYTTMYGDGGTDAYQVMQQIMIDAAEGQLGSGAPQLFSHVPADYVLYPQPVGPESVLEALRRIAQQAGRDVRWFASSSGLVYYSPNREGVSDGVIGERNYEAITDLSWGDEDVRNIWEVYWQDADSNVLGPAGASDGNSVLQYGPRYARVYLTRAENIRDDVHALAFANAALSDSKDPFASHEITMPLDPRIELNDIYTYLANFREYDTDLTFAVAAFRHEWTAADSKSAGVTRTTIGARAKPIAAYRDYRRSAPPPGIVSTQPVPDVLWAPENTVYYQVDSLD